ncbi:MAG: glutaminase [Herbinix sp.]|nr:glutaminase [Herbinix sp.]
MKLRAPAVPLITMDPYFNIWSMNDQLNGDDTRHWTGKQHRLTGILELDGNSYCFMGMSEFTPMKQESLIIDALSTNYIFSIKEVELSVSFVTPLLIEDPVLCARPITYITTKICSKDGGEHRFSIRLIADDEICLDEKGQWDTAFAFGENNIFQWGRVGSIPQKILNKSGDDLRIDWGYLYLAVKNDKYAKASISQLPSVDATATASGRLQVLIDFPQQASAEALISIAYDDNKSIEYFGEPLELLWKTSNTPDILAALSEAFQEYPYLLERCKDFSETLYREAKACGGLEYAELLALAYRQSIAAHKICADSKGELLFISKECFSNGCAATVDVSYPSAPLFLLYNPELVKGMLRPIFKYASSPEWPFDFAPHDAGQYPLVNGQVYGENKLEYQMPIEECGNVLIMMATVCIVQKDVTFALENWDLLEKWANYLHRTGMDPENQLCTDDFAGHLAHNCNLSIKAIMGITGFSILCRMKNDLKQADNLLVEAKKMADQWITMATKTDGTFRLSFDQEDSFSMKYNLIWDKLWGTEIFDLSKFQKEFSSYLDRSNQFGMPLDNRADYTKSDWLLWCATLMDSDTDFAQMIAPLYAAYQNSESRVPLTDWYDTKTAKMIGFQNRTVQGGLFIRLLQQKGVCFVE